MAFSLFDGAFDLNKEIAQAKLGATIELKAGEYIVKRLIILSFPVQLIGRCPHPYQPHDPCRLVQDRGRTGRPGRGNEAGTGSRPDHRDSTLARRPYNPLASPSAWICVLIEKSHCYPEKAIPNKRARTMGPPHFTKCLRNFGLPAGGEDHVAHLA